MPESILNDLSHRRFNLLRGTWILVSPHRTKRPWQGQHEPLPAVRLHKYEPKCYLCPRNKRAQGDINPDYTDTLTFVNDYSVVKENQAEYKPDFDKNDLSSQFLRAESVTGICHVLTFSPLHNKTLADLSPKQILPIVWEWTRIYSQYLDPTSPIALPSAPDCQNDKGRQQYRWMQIFENKGAAMGCSNPHPHCQVWTTSSLPEEAAMELRELKKYRFNNNGQHMLVDYVELELKKGERVVFHNNSFLVVCPWWATWPFEVMIIAKRHKRALVDLNASEQLDFAEAIAEVTRRYDNLFETSFPYSSGIHQAPLTGTDEEINSSHFHMHFYPPLLRSASVKKFIVGYELLAEPQRDITPEQASKRLREDCGGDLYRNTRDDQSE